jgi:hypothetical protein
LRCTRTSRAVRKTKQNAMSMLLIDSFGLIIYICTWILKNMTTNIEIEVSTYLQLSKGKVIIAVELIRIVVYPKSSLKSLVYIITARGMSMRHAVVIARFRHKLLRFLSSSFLLIRSEMNSRGMARAY